MFIRGWLDENLDEEGFLGEGLGEGSFAMAVGGTGSARASDSNNNP